LALLAASALFLGCNHPGPRSSWYQEGIVLGAGERPKSNQLSRQSLEVLNRENLLEQYSANPDAAFKSLLASILKTPSNQENPKLLFTAAELANVLAERGAPAWNRRPHIALRGKPPDPEPPSPNLARKLGAAKNQVLTDYSLASYLSYAYLSVASRNLATDAYHPEFRSACDIYNYSLEQTLRFSLNAIPFHPKAFYRFDEPGGATQARFKLVGFDFKEEDFHEILPAIDYQTDEIGPSSRRFGLGVPLIGIRYKNPNDPNDPYPPVCAFPVTALYIPHEMYNLEATETRDTIHLVNPWAQETLEVGESQIPIEADLSTPLAYLLEHTGFGSNIWKGFKGGDEAQRGMVFLFQPHHVGRIPVVLCHGLLSSAQPWETLVNGLMDDPWVRQHFEFWFMQYPTGQGLLTNADELRKDLVGLRHRLDPEDADPALDHMMMIGHSMGGLIARLLTEDSGDAFWNTVWNAPIDRLDLDPDERGELLRTYYFKRLPFMDRVVFLATPHHGSPTASRPIGWIGTQLVDLPAKSRTFLKSMGRKNKQYAKMGLDEDYFTSVSQLRQDSSFLAALNSIPRAEVVHYHNIVGDISGGKEGGGDGTVPLESARIPWAESELIVPARHTEIHEHPLVIKEIEVLLKKHYETVTKASETAAASGAQQGQ
jgi:pimeloyl-ACP methyl ester carboxylesterase